MRWQDVATIALNLKDNEDDSEGQREIVRLKEEIQRVEDHLEELRSLKHEPSQTRQRPPSAAEWLDEAIISRGLKDGTIVLPPKIEEKVFDSLVVSLSLES